MGPRRLWLLIAILLPLLSVLGSRLDFSGRDASRGIVVELLDTEQAVGTSFLELDGSSIPEAEIVASKVQCKDGHWELWIHGWMEFVGPSRFGLVIAIPGLGERVDPAGVGVQISEQDCVTLAWPEGEEPLNSNWNQWTSAGRVWLFVPASKPDSMDIGVAFDITCRTPIGRQVRLRGRIAPSWNWFVTKSES